MVVIGFNGAKATAYEDQKLNKKALKPMPFHGIIGLKSRMDGHNDFDFEE